MERFNLNLLKQFWAIAKPFWVGDQKWWVLGQLLLVIVLSLGYTGLNVLLNNKRGVLISALSAQDESRFWQTIIVFTGVLVVYAPLFAGYVYFRDRLALQWRDWLTRSLMDRYFKNVSVMNYSRR
jgi:putative ATP-binding cassette transporter